MKPYVIKVLVLVLTISIYFNVSQIITTNQLQNKETVLQETIDALEQNQTDMQNQIDSLRQQLEDGSITIEEPTCNKLYEIEIVVISESDDLEKSINHCTNQSYLGDALDEISEDLKLHYDPRYDKDYMYGRMAVSFYEVVAQQGEYFKISIDTIYSTLGLDYIIIENGSTYQFTLVRWDL